MKKINFILFLIFIPLNLFSKDPFTEILHQDMEKKIRDMNLVNNDDYSGSIFWDDYRLNIIHFYTRKAKGLYSTYAVKYNGKYHIIDYRDIKASLDKQNIKLTADKFINSWSKLNSSINYSVNYNNGINIVVKDSIMYSVVQLDTNSVTKFKPAGQRILILKYDFINKEAKIVNSDIVDLDNSPKLLEKYGILSVFESGGKIWFFSTVKASMNRPTEGHYLVEITDDDKLITRAPANIYHNSIIVRSPVFSTYNGGMRWIGTKYNAESMFRVDPYIYTYSFEKDTVVDEIFYKDLGLSRDSIPYFFHSLTQVSDSTIIVMCNLGEILKISKDKKVTVFYLNDSLKWELAIDGQSYVNPCIDRNGNIWISYPDIKTLHSEYYYDKLIKLDKDNNFTIFDFTDRWHRNIQKRLKIIDARFLTFSAFVGETPSNHKNYDIVFDTEAESSVEDSKVEAYMIGDIKSINLYPNPSNDATNLNIKYNRSNVKRVGIAIYNTKGEMMKDLSSDVSIINMESNIEIDTRDFPSGYYYVTIVTDRNKKYRGLIIK